MYKIRWHRDGMKTKTIENRKREGKIMANHVFGVDVGGTTVKLGLFDINGNVLDKWEIPTDRKSVV